MPSFLPLVEEYLAYRRGLGFALETPAWLLRDFARHVDRRGHRVPLTIELQTGWALSSGSADPAQPARRLAAVRQFARYLALREPASVEQRLRLAVAKASERCPSLVGRRISPHTLRHTTAMHQLQSGVDLAVIALWLGHEDTATTHLYVEADLAMKEAALRSLDEPTLKHVRYKLSDRLLAFLETLWLCAASPPRRRTSSRPAAPDSA